MKHDITRPSMQRIAELQQFIADFAKVMRVPPLGDTSHHENDVEHSFGLALTCWFLAPKIAPGLNVEKILKYALAHDTVEVHAGDTYIFAEQEYIDSKPKRERAAVRQIKKDWPDFQELTEYTAGYMDKRDEEAKFVYAVDKIIPVLMVNLHEKDKFWNEHKVTLQAMTTEKMSKSHFSVYVEPYFHLLIGWMSDPDYFYSETAG